tara:strand:- start:166 stop:828 length:663 start_codon:yes stop_codon:yes gene_type:complete
MLLTITKKAVLVLDVVTPLLLVATSSAAIFVITEILVFYDFYRPDPAGPWEYFSFFGQAFFVVTFLYLVWVTPTTLRLLVNLCFPSLIFTLIYTDSSVQIQIGTGIGFIFWLGFLWVFLSKSMHYYACFWAVFSGLVIFNLGNQFGLHPINSYLIFWCFFVPHGLASITALGLRDFWLSYLRPRAMSRGMSVTNIRLVELYAPMIIAMTVFVPSMIYLVN